MNIMLRLCGVLLTTAVLNACGAIPVSTDFDPEWHQPASATFAWLPKPAHSVDPMVDNDLVAARIHRAVDEQLEAKGFTATASEAQASVLVTYHIGEEEKLDINTFHSNFGYYPCWHCWGPGFDNDVWVSQYTQGKLVIDVVDAQTKKLVWRGVASRRVPDFKSPQERDTYMRETVAAIFKKFTPS
ncbi:MAG: hypothetical protein JWM78_1313 [Verrucomicrobiaceae bacterium]|nr:hypothetical protein [Verrucomicrobiaceae bacterium]